jgi:hypothetical protein
MPVSPEALRAAIEDLLKIDLPVPMTPPRLELIMKLLTMRLKSIQTVLTQCSH